MMDYEPIRIYEGDNIQKVKLIFGRSTYRQTMEVQIPDKLVGFYLIEYALKKAHDKLKQGWLGIRELNLTDPAGGETLVFCEEHHEGADFLKPFLLSAEIVEVKDLWV
jgi:hypothetical protein